MKRIFGLMLAVAMVLSMNVSAYAADGVSIDEEEMLQAISALDESFQNEDGCSTEVVGMVVDENDYPADEYMNCNARETTVPKTYYNISLNGIYKGSFSNLRSTMYTSKYFDTQDGEYYSRVRCYGEYPSLTYKAGNYCITCKKVLSTSESNYYTPSTPWQDGNWVSFHHTLGSSHADHFVCPFVTNTSGSINGELYAIGGDIWANYTNSWS
jgi:hypothetical protein